MTNIEFNDFSPTLVAQLILSSSFDENNKDLFPKEFYNALLSSATILKSLQFLPGEKKSLTFFSSVPYSLEGIFTFFENYNVSDELLIDLIMDDFITIDDYYSENNTLDYFTDENVAKYLNDELLDAIDVIKFELIPNPSKYVEILETLNYIKTLDINKLQDGFNMMAKYI